LSATAVALQTAAELAPLAAVFPVDDALDDEFGDAMAAPISPPPTPTTMKPIISGAHGHQRRLGWSGPSCLPLAGTRSRWSLMASSFVNRRPMAAHADQVPLQDSVKKIASNAIRLPHPI
jgi:hypothetical protein